MSVFFRGGPHGERRSADWFALGNVLNGGSTKSGVNVTPARALTVGAMWSSVDLLASIVSTLPVDVFRGAGANKSAVSPQPLFVASPSLVVSRRDWVYQAMQSMLLRGNAYGLVVERDSLQRPRAVEWLSPDVVTVGQASALDRPTYKVGEKPVSRDDIIHMLAYPQAGSAVGLSPVEYHAETIGTALAARNFGAQWFGEGGHPSAIFQNTEKTMDPAESRAVKDRLVSILRGKREPLTLGKDWKYQAIQVSPNESQFLESMGYTDSQIAHIYGPGVAEVLGYASGEGSSLTYSNRVDRSLDLLTYSVMRWVVKFEDMWTENIAQPQTARINTSALLRADNKSRWDVHRIRREIGAANIDEIRALEDEAPLPDGQGQDYTPLKVSGSNTEGQIPDGGN